jgi:anaphase-promoting complex subunit 8
LDSLDAARTETPVVVEALVFLAKHCMDKGFWKEAEKYCFRLLDFNVPEKEDARLLLKKIHEELSK